VYAKLVSAHSTIVGLREIGQEAFDSCNALNKVHTSDGVEIIGLGAFGGCNFVKFKRPPFVTTISIGMLADCKIMELPKNILKLKAMRAADAIHCEMLPLHPTPWLMDNHIYFMHCMHLSTVRTFYAFSTQLRQLRSH
jgi:hypothetical protein